MSGRENLRQARRERGLTQQQVADSVGISWRQYQRIEMGRILGRIEVWDALEDLFGVHQRRLREVLGADGGRQPPEEAELPEQRDDGHK